MTFTARLTAKIVLTLAATAISFLAAASLYSRWYDRYVLPELVKRYPHDGQIGLDAFVKSISWGAAAAILVFLLGCIWVLNTSRSPRPTS